jgi:hypothetical protein
MVHKYVEDKINPPVNEELEEKKKENFVFDTVTKLEGSLNVKV